MCLFFFYLFIFFFLQDVVDLRQRINKLEKEKLDLTTHLNEEVGSIKFPFLSANYK